MLIKMRLDNYELRKSIFVKINPVFHEVPWGGEWRLAKMNSIFMHNFRWAIEWALSHLNRPHPPKTDSLSACLRVSDLSVKLSFVKRDKVRGKENESDANYILWKERDRQLQISSPTCFFSELVASC